MVRKVGYGNRPRLSFCRRKTRAGHRLTARPTGLASFRRSILRREMRRHSAYPHSRKREKEGCSPPFLFLKTAVRVRRIELRSPPWQGGVLPLNHARIFDTFSTNPRSLAPGRITHRSHARFNFLCRFFGGEPLDYTAGMACSNELHAIFLPYLLSTLVSSVFVTVFFSTGFAMTGCATGLVRYAL